MAVAERAQRDYQRSADAGSPPPAGPVSAAEVRRRWDESQRATSTVHP